MGASRIEQIIEDIYEYIERCKPSAFSQSKVIVPKDELYDLLDELRLRTPDEIKRYQKIISNRDAIIKDAEDKAAAIIEEAKTKAAAMVSENEIMQQAFYQGNEMISNASAQAEELLSSANRDSEQIRSGALSYTNEVLVDIENMLSDAYESTKAKSEMLLATLKMNLDTVVSNRMELNGQNMQESEYEDYSMYEESKQSSQQDESEDEFSFDENTFMEDIE